MIKIYHNYNYCRMQTELLVVDEKLDGSKYIAKPIDLVFEKDDSCSGKIIEPTLIFNGVEGHELLKGIEGAFGERSSNKEIDAIKYHLEDMRKLVFK